MKITSVLSEIQIAHYVSVVALAALSSGCSSLPISHSTISTKQVYAPDPSKALVIFLRPDFVGGAYDSALFDIKPTENHLIGIINYHEAAAYQADAGDHVFMAYRNAAFVMPAHLEAGKTYYVQVISITDSHNFTLFPYGSCRAEDQHYREEGPAVMRESTFMDVTPRAAQWAQSHSKEITAALLKGAAIWTELTEDAKAAGTLEACNGI